MRALRTHAHLLPALVAQEDALVGVGLLAGLHYARDSACVGGGRVDGEGAVDVSARLVELDGLPGVLGGLADAGAVDDAGSRRIVCHIVRVSLDVPFDLILSETQGQIQFK